MITSFMTRSIKCASFDQISVDCNHPGLQEAVELLPKPNGGTSWSITFDKAEKTSIYRDYVAYFGTLSIDFLNPMKPISQAPFSFILRACSSSRRLTSGN